MTYWERIIRSASKDKSVDHRDINGVDVFYTERLHCHTIEDAGKALSLLSTHSSFVEVQETLQLPDTIEYMSCVNIIRRPFGVDKFMVEEFYKDGSSYLENEIEKLEKTL